MQSSWMSRGCSSKERAASKPLKLESLGAQAVFLQDTSDLSLQNRDNTLRNHLDEDGSGQHSVLEPLKLVPLLGPPLFDGDDS